MVIPAAFSWAMVRVPVCIAVPTSFPPDPVKPPGHAARPLKSLPPMKPTQPEAVSMFCIVRTVGKVPTFDEKVIGPTGISDAKLLAALTANNKPPS